MTVDENMIRTAPVLFDIVSGDGRIVYANETEESALGFKAGALAGSGIELIYPPDSRLFISRIIGGDEPSPAMFVRLQVRCADRKVMEIAANIDVTDHEDHGPCARIVKFPLESTLRKLDHLQRENEVLSSIVSTARDASYCIDFIEPVDLTAPGHEVIRQVFENQSCWRYCNEAMSRLYKLPVGDDLNLRDVREVFPRNSDNEVFIGTLINNNWNVDGALSRDSRYDGVDVLIENDVRADIRHGQLHRFWGVVRELSARRMHEREREDEASDALDILAAIPDPVIVTSMRGQIVGANPAVEWSLGWPLDALLGRDVSDIFRTPADLRERVSNARTASSTVPIEAIARCRDGTYLACSGRVSSTVRQGREPRCVLTFRVGASSLNMGRAS